MIEKMKNDNVDNKEKGGIEITDRDESYNNIHIGIAKISVIFVI